MSKIYLANILIVFFPLACASTTPAPGAAYAPKTTLALMTPRCTSPGVCACREPEGEGQREEKITPGQKRFEFRLPQTTSAIWVEIEGQGVYYKPSEKVLPSCFYLDLPAGEHRVTLHGERRDRDIGLQTALAINEYGPKDGPHWYHALDFVCGSQTTRCTKDGMEAWIAWQRKQPRGVLDPCGSTMLRGVTSSGTREERLSSEYVEFTLRFVLKVYAFETYQAPRSPECKAPVKNR
jgi:hypothetical protein